MKKIIGISAVIVSTSIFAQYTPQKNAPQPATILKTIHSTINKKSKMISQLEESLLICA